jgi:hypothetical protein
MDKPKSVSTAVFLLYIALILGIIGGLIAIFSQSAAQGMPAQQMSPAGGIIAIIIVALINWFFIFKIGRGRNWARIVYLILFILGVIGWILGFTTAMETQGLLPVIIGLVNLVLVLIAMILVFSGRGAAYFRS